MASEFRGHRVIAFHAILTFSVSTEKSTNIFLQFYDLFFKLENSIIDITHVPNLKCSVVEQQHEEAKQIPILLLQTATKT